MIIVKNSKNQILAEKIFAVFVLCDILLLQACLALVPLDKVFCSFGFENFDYIMN